MTKQHNVNDRNMTEEDNEQHLNVVRYIPRSIPTTDICDEPTRTIVCNEEWAKHIFGAIETLTLWTAWEGERDERNLGVQQVLKMLAGQCGGSSTMEFRDNPLDGCEVQYSNDNGLTWTTMFRKDSCISPAQPGDITNIYNDIDTINTNNTNYAGDILNVAPQWDYDPLVTDVALCYIVDIFVDMVCDVSISQIQSGNTERRESNDWINDIATGLADAAIGALVVSPIVPVVIPAAALSALGFAAATFIESALDYLATDNYEDYEDEDVRDVVKCMIIANMKGKTPTFANWSTALQYFSSLGAEAQTVARSVYLWMQDLNVFINYFIMWDDINSIADLLPECACPERWSHFWDFTTVGMDDFRVGDYGVKTPGVGVVATDKLEDGYHSMLISMLDFGAEINEKIPRCDGIEFHMEMVRGTWDSNGTALYMYNPPAPFYEANSGFAITGNTGWRHNFALCDVTFQRIWTLKSCFTKYGSLGSVVVTGMTFHGEGVDPFYGRITE
jgi:hypothetical protein